MGQTEKGRFEMLWDCPGCGTEKLLGLSQRHCPNCGAPQDPTRRYFPADGEAVAVEGHPYQGADVTCAACDTPNAARATFCVGCGSPLDGAKAVRTRDEQASKGGFAADSAAEAAKEAEAARQRDRAKAAESHARASGAAPPPKSRSWAALLVPLGCGGLLLAGIVLAAVFFLWKKDAAMVVNGHSWERSVAVESYGPKRGEAWRDAVPSGAYDISCRPEKKDTKKVADGEVCEDKRRDKGDGTFVVVQDCKTTYREEPVYADKCTYSVDTWQVTRTERASGKDLSSTPSWPPVSLGRTGVCVGCEREGARKETYTVHFSDSASGADHSCDVAEDRWRSMAMGSRWSAQVGVMSGSLDCSSLTPSR
jgi:hypothetical protein